MTRMNDEIIALAQAYSDAVRDKDVRRLAEIYAEDVQVFDAWGLKPFEGLAAWRNNLESWLNGLAADERVEAVFDAVHISSLGDMGALHARDPRTHLRPHRPRPEGRAAGGIGGSVSGAPLPPLDAGEEGGLQEEGADQRPAQRDQEQAP